MSVEAHTLAERMDARAARAGERRGTDRRRRDRRKEGSRVNRVAPRNSLLKALSAQTLVAAVAIFVLTLLGREVLGLDVPGGVLMFEAAAIATCVIALALGGLEQRLIEIRLELMMLNGGRRSADRREQERRTGDRRSDRDLRTD